MFENRKKLILIIAGIVLFGLIGYYIYSTTQNPVTELSKLQQESSKVVVGNNDQQTELIVDKSPIFAESFKIANDTNYDILRRNQLIDGRIVLEIPIQNANDPYIQPLYESLGLGKITSFFKEQKFQTVFYNPATNVYETPQFHVYNLLETKTNNQIYWIYLSNDSLRISKPNFVDSQIYNSEEVNNIDTIKLDKPMGENIFLRLYSSNNSITNDYDLIKYSIPELLTTRQTKFDIIYGAKFNSEAKLIDDEIRKQVSLELSETKKNKSIPTTDSYKDYYYYFPLANGKVVVHTTYYSDNFWLYSPNQKNNYTYLEKLKLLETDNNYFSCSVDKNTCYILNVKQNKLTKVDLNSDELATTNIEINKLNFEKDYLLRSKQAIGSETEALLKLNSNKLQFWYAGNWIDLAAV